MTLNENVIKTIVYEEFLEVINNIEGDFNKNFNKKRHNFTISQLDEKTIANMVFVSSFESKSGFAIEACAKRIARLRFGDDNVPTIVNPRKINHSLNPDKIKGQVLVTDIDLDDGDLKGSISKFRASNVASGKGKKRIESRVTQDSIKTLIPIAQKYRKSEIHHKPVDLAIFDGNDWLILELKAGGDLDSSNAPGNIEKLLSIYAGLNVENAKVFFATLYNKNGEGNKWSGTAKKHMAYPEMFLIGKEFWELILPKDITFEKFTEIYKSALEDINLNDRIIQMINNTLK